MRWNAAAAHLLGGVLDVVGEVVGKHVGAAGALQVRESFQSLRGVTPRDTSDITGTLPHFGRLVAGLRGTG